ncbi:hypothetical protein EYC84_010232 [Monilinia fructicola]|uniref:Uncharacterized protein n=1 Tax=Monilinia fructicola TaxID=38448 RepID=A0A5M9JH95_MONFR|nr:hypothetical protein EYC84_010232 [Monilinia fructicola]
MDRSVAKSFNGSFFSFSGMLVTQLWHQTQNIQQGLGGEFSKGYSLLQKYLTHQLVVISMHACNLRNNCHIGMDFLRLFFPFSSYGFHYSTSLLYLLVPLRTQWLHCVMNRIDKLIQFTSGLDKTAEMLKHEWGRGEEGRKKLHCVT